MELLVASVELALLCNWIECAKADASRGCARGMVKARLNALRRYSSGTLGQDNRADKHLVSLDSGETHRQGGALGDGKVVHLLVRCTCTRFTEQM